MRGLGLRSLEEVAPAAFCACFVEAAERFLDRSTPGGGSERGFFQMLAPLFGHGAFELPYVPTRVFGPPPSTELTTITSARFIVCATRSTTTAVAPRAPFQHAAMAMCSTSRHGFLRRVEARRAGT